MARQSAHSHASRIPCHRADNSSQPFGGVALCYYILALTPIPIFIQITRVTLLENSKNTMAIRPTSEKWYVFSTICIKQSPINLVISRLIGLYTVLVLQGGDDPHPFYFYTQPRYYLL